MFVIYHNTQGDAMKIKKNLLSAFFVSFCSQLHAFKLGIENDTIDLGLFKNKRVGLVTNQTGVTQDGARTLDVLRARGFNVALLLAPEHGIKGDVPAGTAVLDAVDEATGTNVISLYAGGAHSKNIPTNLKERVDALFFDLQDAGMRHYTYISSLYKILEFCATNELPLIVFDRPNLLGDVMEGPLVEPGLVSFISIAPIPLRHGLTIGEIARYFNEQVLGRPAQLTVVPMIDYNRTWEPDRLLAPLSPNLRTREACFGYSFMGILGELRGLFIGMRTARPFGALMFDAERVLTPAQLIELRVLLHSCGVSSVPAHVASASGKEYRGLALTIEHIVQVPAFSCLVHVLDFFRRAGVSLVPSALFDKAVGTPVVRKLFLGEVDIVDVARAVNDPLAGFAQRVKPYLLYEPAPRVLLLT